MTEEEIVAMLSQIPQETGYMRPMDMSYLDFAQQLGLDMNEPGAIDWLGAAVNSYRAGVSPEMLRETLAERTMNEPSQYQYDPNDPYGIGAWTSTQAAPGEWNPATSMARGYLIPPDSPLLAYSSGDHTGVALSPEIIQQVKDDARDRQWNGVGQTLALVGGSALASALAPGAAPGAGTTQHTGQAVVSGSNVAAGTAPGLAPGTAANVGFGAMQGVPTGAGFAAAPLTAGTGAVGGGLLPGVAAGAGGLSGVTSGSGGLGQTLSRVFQVRGPDGALDLGRILQLGGAGLGIVNALFNRPEEAQPPARPPWMDAPLQPQSSPRVQTPLEQSSYYTYGQSGPEHSFFAPQPSNVPTNFVPPQRFEAGGSVAGPGTGRSDEIPAQLSDGEYVMDAETVALLGDGSTEAGSRKLDELRRKLRAHKGKALAKGKFSPDAKEPEEYMGMAKGGNIRRFNFPKGSEEERMTELEALRRLVDTYRRKKETRIEDRGHDPYNKPRVGKAEGGKVKGVNMLADLADKLEGALDLGDTNSQTLITRQIEAIEPKFKMAKGGNVRTLLNQIRASMSPTANAQRVSDLKKGVGPRPTQAPALAAELTRMNPQAPVLERLRSKPLPVDTRRRRTTEERLEGEDLMHLLEKGERR